MGDRESAAFDYAVGAIGFGFFLPTKDQLEKFLKALPPELVEFISAELVQATSTEPEKTTPTELTPEQFRGRLCTMLLQLTNSTKEETILAAIVIVEEALNRIVSLLDDEAAVALLSGITRSNANIELYHAKTKMEEILRRLKERDRVSSMSSAIRGPNNHIEALIRKIPKQLPRDK